MKKIAICVILVFLVMGAVISVSAVSGNFQKIILPTKDTQVDAGVIEQPELDERGYEITFSSTFFDDLEAAHVSLYVDGKQVTEAPENNTMRGIIVELKGVDVNTYYCMNITPYNGVMPYASTVGGEFCTLSEFNMPLCLVLLDNVLFEGVYIK